MAGKLIIDTIQTEASFLQMNVSNTRVATINASGIFSNTGTKMIGYDGTIGAATIANTAIIGNITGSQLANATITGLNISNLDTASANGVGALQLPSGTTAQRPAGANGQFRYNTTTSKGEIYQNGEWVSYALAYSVDYLIVAGGGAGGGSPTSNMTGGGGGGGGYISGSYSVVSGTANPVVIGAAGAIASAERGGSGGTSSIFGSSAVGGGGGGGGVGANGTAPGLSGGSGGGSAGWYTGTVPGGSGTPGQGNPGGAGGVVNGAGGGGGAGAAGGNGNNAPTPAGVGGAGLNWQSVGTYYAGGGGGGAFNGLSSMSGGAGGSGGGGAGESTTGSARTGGLAGTTNTGGGGGGTGAWGPPFESVRNGFAGGSGVVIVRYSGAQKATGGTVTSAGGYVYHTFTSSGTFTA